MVVKYETIADRLLKDVLTGRLKPGKRVPSEKELAGDYEVSIQTVNKAISVLVSSGVLVRRGVQGAFVSEFIDLARLRKGRQLQIGIVYDARVQTITDSDRVLGRLTFHLQHLLGRDSYAWTLLSRADGDDLENAVDNLDGLVTIGDVEPAVLDAVARRRLPAVAFNRDFRDRGLGAVLIGTEAIEGLVGHLFESGHRRFLFVANDSPRQVYAIRKAAFDRAVERRGVSPRALVIPEGRMKAEQPDAASLAVIRDCDAAFLPNDQMAIVFLHMLERCGLRVPEDLSVCGHDDTVAARHCSVPLTTVAYDLQEAAAVIVKTLGDVVYGRAECPLAVIPSRVVPRASSAVSRSAGGQP